MIKSLFRKSPELDFFAKEQDYYKLHRALAPDYSAKFLPEWFKELSNHYTDRNSYGMEFSRATIKTCIGIRNLLTNGIIIPMWSDLLIDIYPDKTVIFQFSDSNRTAIVHDISQHGNLYQDCVNVKLVSPWIAKSNISKQFYLTSPFYNVGKSVDFYICPGFLDFNYSHAMNINMLFKVKDEKYRVTIPAGFPLIQLISTEKNISKISIKSIPSETWDGMSQATAELSFTNSYSKVVRLIKARYG